MNVQAISKEEFDSRTSAQANSAAAVQAAEAAVETARLNIGWTQVRSPIAGRVSRAEVTEGNLVQSGPPDATLLTTVVSLDSMYLYFDSDEQTYLRYSARAAEAAPGTAAGTARDSPSISASPTRPDFPTRAGWTSSTTRSTRPAAPSAPARSSPTATAGSRPGSSPG